MIKCWLRAERHDGNDPIEATVDLAHRPSKGEYIEVWYSDYPHWLEVQQVVHAAYGEVSGGDPLEVWVKMDGYDLADLERAFEAAKKREKP